MSLEEGDNVKYSDESIEAQGVVTGFPEDDDKIFVDFEESHEWAGVKKVDKENVEKL